MIPDKLRIAIVAHGRFHMFDLAREVLKLGHDVHLFTNYPRHVAARFGVPRDRTTTFLAHGVGSRVLGRLFPRGFGGRVERLTNTSFGRWVAAAVTRSGWDVVASMSGVAVDLFRRLEGTPTLKVLHRGSAHIRVQREILDAEARRVGAKWIDRPSDWIIDREEEEYDRADLIQVLSGFAKLSFRGTDVAEKVAILQLGVDTSSFQATPAALEARYARIMAQEPIRLLNVGTFSLQKGAAVWAEILTAQEASRYRFRFVGPVARDAAGLAKQLAGRAEFVRKLPQHRLPHEYEWGDVFVLPTVQDGFAAVLTQALASGLPLITTTNCAGPDLIREGVNGWIVPIQDPAALLTRLDTLDTDRVGLANAVRATQADLLDFDWSMTARQFIQNVITTMATIGSRTG